MPLNLTETLNLLRDIGQNPRGSLGQNFLIDGNIVEKSELDRIENYESSNDAFVVEEYGMVAVAENIVLV